jgi:hypothetical protein
MKLKMTHGKKSEKEDGRDSIITNKGGIMRHFFTRQEHPSKAHFKVAEARL